MIRMPFVNAPRREAVRVRLILGFVSLAGAGSGCVEDGGAQSDANAQTDAAVVGGNEDSGEAEGDANSGCASQSDGELCGSDMYCMSGRCQPSRCGDGVRTGSEACDDGNQRGEDGCDPGCRVEVAGCGDGEIGADEECDDGNWIDQDDCSNRCTRKECGNERVDLDEECDDGNRVDDDTCSNACLVIACRNGRVDVGEECDDGNTIDDDGCTNACQALICGNGKVEKYEDCDDGNSSDQDSCLSTCRLPSVCGNGMIEPGEACERGDSRILDKPDGTGELQDCARDCRGWGREADGCAACQSTVCGDVLGIDVFRGCLTAIDAQFEADPQDPFFLSSCIAAVQCSLRTQCFAGVDGPLSCYCGSASRDTCNARGPAEDAPCRTEWEEAAQSTAIADVLQNVSNLKYPAAWAYYFLDCYRVSATGPYLGSGLSLSTTCEAECGG